MKTTKQSNFFAKTLGSSLVLVLLSTTSQAAELTNNTRLALGGKIGTQGVGIEGRMQLNDKFYARAGANYFYYNYKAKTKILQYKAKLTLLTVPIMLDYHPIENSGFRVSLGAAYNGNKVTASAEPAANITISGISYTPTQVGRVSSKLTFKNTIAPIMTIGYDSSFISDKSYSFNAELGAMYAGSYKLKLSASGALGAYQPVIDGLKQDVSKKLKKDYLKIFPILSVGFKYNF